MSKISFESSFQKKGGLTRFAANLFLKEQGHIFSTGSKKFRRRFTKQIEDIVPEISFFDESVKRSKHSPENKFTNYLNSKTESHIKTAIYNVFKSPSIVDCSNASQVRFNNPKILECLRLYHEQITNNDLVFKSNLETYTDQKVEVRVFCIPEFETTSLRAKYKIVLIDPFHLVIPSQHGGRQKEFVETENYNKNRDNTICMQEYINSVY